MYQLNVPYCRPDFLNRCIQGRPYLLRPGEKGTEFISKPRWKKLGLQLLQVRQ